MIVYEILFGGKEGRVLFNDTLDTYACHGQLSTEMRTHYLPPAHRPIT